MMTKVLNLTAAILAAGSLALCSSVDVVDRDAPRRAESDANPKAAGAVSEELAALGITVAQQSETNDWSTVLGIEQVTSETQGSDYAFKDVEGIHPCQREDVITDDCREISARLAEQLAAEQTGRGTSALSELQAITPDVVDPQSFDPVVTADELGRLPVPQSQAAQALGFQLLQPPAPVPVEPEPEDPAVDDFGNLPDIPLDVLITQTPGTGS
ncbi:MAG: hypothetical protein AAF683_03225 [Pseudomonadota bacterium]